MVPRIGGKGFSFKGAGEYHLHDKGAKTSERVTWTHGHNLPQDQKQAIRHMIDTASHADELKKQAGIKNTGRKSNAHVYTYSLGWKAGEEIDDKTMKEAGLESLKALGLSKHQVLFVRHNDTDHAHVHLIVNRVDPETGVLATLKNDRVKLSKWAQDYELRHGGIQCEAREENNEKRQSEYVKHYEQATRKEYLAEKLRVTNFWQQMKTDRKSYHQEEGAKRKVLFEAKEEQIKDSQKLAKELFRPHWAKLYQTQREEMKAHQEEEKAKVRELKELARYGKKEQLTDYQNRLYGGQKATLDMENRHKQEVEAVKKDPKKMIESVYQEHRDTLKQDHEANQEKLKSNNQGQSQERREFRPDHLTNQLKAVYAQVEHGKALQALSEKEKENLDDTYNIIDISHEKRKKALEQAQSKEGEEYKQQTPEGRKKQFNSAYLNQTHATQRRDLSNQYQQESKLTFKAINQQYKADRLTLVEKQNQEKSSFDVSMKQRVKDFYNSNDNEATQETSSEGRERTRENIQQRNEPS